MELEVLHTGVITLDNYELPCYVLNNEMRVLSQREVVKLITGGRESGNLTRYLDARALQQHLPDKFKANSDRKPLIFKAGTSVAHGLEAKDVVDICKAYLKARMEGTLQPNQAKIAEQAEMFIAACAKTGIDAIIDEATGYQYFRRVNELQEKFNAYLQEEYREWTLTFPQQIFMQFYKLEGRKPPSPPQPYPLRFGKYIMQYVYDTLDPEIADYLRKNNPDPGGTKHHHQLFNDFGYKNLQNHVMSVLGIMKASINFERFTENICVAFPNAKTKKHIRLQEHKIAKAMNEEYRQANLFDYIETVNTPNKEDNEAYGMLDANKEEKNENSISFGDAISKISKAGRPPNNE